MRALLFLNWRLTRFVQLYLNSVVSAFVDGCGRLLRCTFFCATSPCFTPFRQRSQCSASHSNRMLRETMHRGSLQRNGAFCVSVGKPHPPEFFWLCRRRLPLRLCWGETLGATGFAVCFERLGLGVLRLSLLMRFLFLFLHVAMCANMQAVYLMRALGKKMAVKMPRPSLNPHEERTMVRMIVDICDRHKTQIVSRGF